MLFPRNNQRDIEYRQKKVEIKKQRKTQPFHMKRRRLFYLFILFNNFLKLVCSSLQANKYQLTPGE